MLQLSALQLAELLSGVARAQAAIIHGIESALPGTRASHIVPALQNVAHLREHPDPTLTDLPVRTLLAYIGRIGPDLEAMAHKLERVASEPPAKAPAPPADTAAPGAEGLPPPRRSPDITTTRDLSDLHSAP
ncbi:MAG TPA: hypothetical protein VNF69_08745 [Burkholderiales bacterium]|nr:hypothetical protein [Burkholderiales bacterium]